MESRDSELETEVIDFFKPLENAKNLIITNIFTTKEAVDNGQTVAEIHNAFSRFGLMYEIQVLPTKPQPKENVLGLFDNLSVPGDNKFNAATDDLSCKPTLPSLSTNAGNAEEVFYAFVKFYSAKAAKQAQRSLHLSRLLGSGTCKVNFAQRRKALKQKRQKLYVTQCRDLANFYLGFNGWSTSIRLHKRLEPEVILEHLEDIANCDSGCSDDKCKFLCIVDLSINKHNLETYGIGIAEETLPKNTVDQGTVFARGKKRAHHYALQNAFSKVMLVVLSNGKVYPEIDTTIPDPVVLPDFLQPSEHNFIKVQYFEQEEIDDDDDDENNQETGCFTELDFLNIETLQDLENQLQS